MSMATTPAYLRAVREEVEASHQTNAEDAQTPVEFDGLASLPHKLLALLARRHLVAAGLLDGATLEEEGGLGKEEADEGSEEGGTGAEPEENACEGKKKAERVGGSDKAIAGRCRG